MNKKNKNTEKRNKRGESNGVVKEIQKKKKKIEYKKPI